MFKIRTLKISKLPRYCYEKNHFKLTANTFEIIKEGDYVVCAVSGKNIPLSDLTYWNVELQEAYYSPKEAKIRFEQIKSKK